MIAKILFTALLIIAPLKGENFAALKRHPIDAYRESVVNEDSNLKVFNSLDSSLAHFFNSWSIVGASVAVMQHGSLKFAKGYGSIDRSGKGVVQPTNTFRIASVSKLITAIAIMKLIDEKKLNLNDKVFGIRLLFLYLLRG